MEKADEDIQAEGGGGMSDAKTQWLGLWKTREGVYSGQTIKRDEIPDHAKLIVRYNKFYESDSNRPRFVYCFASGNAEKAITIEITNDEYVTLEDAEELQTRYCFTYDELQTLINRVACSAGGDGEYGEHCVGDFVDTYSYGLNTYLY